MTAIASSTKGLAGTARASAVLLGSGAYDDEAAATTLDLQRSAWLGLFCTYTRGGSNGAATLKVLVSHDNVTFFPLLVPNSSVASGALAEFRALIALPVSAGSAAETYALPPLDVRPYAWAKILAAETGATGTPGTLAIVATASTR